MNNKALLIYSGGLDSTTLLYKLLMTGWTVEALSFDYGQRHRKELDAAREITGPLGIRHDVINLQSLGRQLIGSSQTDEHVDVPDGHYEEESMKKTVVPNRNMVMLSIGASIALARRIPWLAYAAHAGDHAIYPDCRPEFVDAMEVAFQRCDWNRVALLAPYVRNGLDKGGIVREGSALGVPYNLTWTCYKGRTLHCGTCGSCRERIDAFKAAGVPDPTAYEKGVPGG